MKYGFSNFIMYDQFCIQIEFCFCGKQYLQNFINMISSLPTHITIQFTQQQGAKQILNLMKLIKYAYSFSKSHECDFYIYVCNAYICFVNEFEKYNYNYHPCLCTLYKEEFSFINGSQTDFYVGEQEMDGYLYRVDVGELLRFLIKTKKLCLSLDFKFPLPSDNYVGQLEIFINGKYGCEFDCKLQAQIVQYKKFPFNNWPFHGGSLTNECLLMHNAQSVEFMKLSAQKISQINYAQKFPDICFEIQPQGILLKHIEKGNEHISHRLKIYKNENWYKKLNAALNGKNFILVKSSHFFMHLSLVSFNSVECDIQIFIEKSKYYFRMRNCLGVSEMFQVQILSDLQRLDHKFDRRRVQITSILRENAQQQAQKIILNAYGGMDYQETLNLDLAVYKEEISVSAISSQSSWIKSEKSIQL